MATTYPTTMHGPAATAPTVSNKVAQCLVCRFQRAIMTMEEPYTEMQGCPFCDAPASAQILLDESPDYSGGGRN